MLRDGEINLEKHPLIAPLAIKQTQLESQIRGKLNHLMHSDNYQSRMQFDSLDLLNDRYVLPIKSDSFNKSLGQIISRSETGNTLFVEPKEVSQLNYQRLEIVVEIQSILAKIESDLTIILKSFSNELNTIATFFYLVDEYTTRAKFSNKFNLTRPVLRQKKGFKIINGFHPLIDNPIKNDVSLDDSQGGLIISGPNTGGKTATLKMLTLTQLFLHYGLFVPCEYGEIYLYKNIFYFGNDNQDLSLGLSSFSAEVSNYTSLLESLGDSNLILIDEIFNSTSSEEASALAVALFKQIHKISNSHIIVSSHHQTLKTILHQDKFYASAHVGFDMDSNTPTYKLHYGSPGSSQALRIFNSITSEHPLFTNVYENALHFLDNQVIHYEKLLESLAHKEHSLQKIISENQEINLQIKNQKSSMEGVLKLKLQDQLARAEVKIKKLIEKAESIVSEAKTGNVKKHSHIDKHRHIISKELKDLSPSEEKVIQKHQNFTPPDNFTPGESYYCIKLEKTVTLKRLEKNKKDALVSSGSMAVKVPLKSLMLANASKAKSNNQQAETSFFISKAHSTKLEHDCRGMRLEEFQNLINNLASDLLLGDIPFATIIHGHGSGVLKNWLRKHLKNHKDLVIVPNETGNDGETRIAVK